MPSADASIADLVGMKPCPHCEGPGYFVWNRTQSRGSVKCTRPSCGATGGAFESTRDAYEAWNTRAEDPAIPALSAEVARLRDERDTPVIEEQVSCTISERHFLDAIRKHEGELVKVRFWPDQGGWSVYDPRPAAPDAGIGPGVSGAAAVTL